MKVTSLNWVDLDTVLLDLDGTLLDLHFDNYFWLQHVPKRWAEMTGGKERDCREYLLKTYDEMRGTLDWYCLDFWSDKLQLDIVALKLEILEKVGLRPDADKFLRFLGDQKKEVILVTNGHRDGMDLKLAETGIEGHFDQIVSSHDYRVPKEEQLFWQRLKQEHAFDNNRTLFIDDNHSVLRSAEIFGIANLVQILQPDLQRPSHEVGDFPAIEHFAEILN
jgi:putative hydrolase of the HAD superfamily